MSILRDGRNEIRVSNSGAKCLLENWVEERSVKHIDPDINIEGNVTSKLQLLKGGHKGIFSTDFDAACSDKTTARTTYTQPNVDITRQKGSKEELMKKMYFEKFCKMKFGQEPMPEKTDFRSIKMVDYDFVFTPECRPPTKDHSYRSEQAITFWSEHRDKIHGTTQVKTGDTAFRRNDAFSKPIGEYWNEAQPNELEEYPKM